MYRPYWLIFLVPWVAVRAEEETTKPARLHWPTDPRGAVSDAGRFGARREGGRIHGGLDIGVGHLTTVNGQRRPAPVYAAETGRVVSRVANYGGRGQAVVVDHGDLTTVYGHIDSSVRIGDAVTRGQQIGTVAHWPGNEHLHFGVHRGAYDPQNPNRSLRGLYPEDTSLADVGALSPREFLEDPADLARRQLRDGPLTRDVAQQLAEFLRRPAGSDSPAATEQEKVERPSSGETRATESGGVKVVNFGPFRVTVPRGWRAENREASTIGGTLDFSPEEKGREGRPNQASFFLFEHPGWPNQPRTPESLIRRLSVPILGDRPVRYTSVKVGRPSWAGAGVSYHLHETNRTHEHVVIMVGGRFYMATAIHPPGNSDVPAAFREFLKNLDLRSVKETPSSGLDTLEFADAASREEAPQPQGRSAEEDIRLRSVEETPSSGPALNPGGLPPEGLASEYLGVRLDGKQCVPAARDLLKHLYPQKTLPYLGKDNPQTAVVENGAWQLFRVDTPGLQKVPNNGKATPPPGSLIVWDQTVGNGAGHVSLVLGTVNGDTRTVRVVDGNARFDLRGRIRNVQIGPSVQGWLVPAP